MKIVATKRKGHNLYGAKSEASIENCCNLYAWAKIVTLGLDRPLAGQELDHFSSLWHHAEPTKSLLFNKALKTVKYKQTMCPW